jgi:GNAT superfamily N-acetyltransferase
MARDLATAPAASAAALDIGPLADAEVAELLPMWRAYQEFYRVPAAEIDEARNRRHIERILADEGLGQIFLARQVGGAAGFATVYYSFSSTRSCRIGIINDLYVEARQRGRGYGARLLRYCIAFVRRRGLLGVEWATLPDNLRAQSLYDKFAKPQLWCVYGVATGAKE